MERLVQLNKPFALIFGIQCFNSGGFTRILSNFSNLQIVFLPRRLKFHKGVESKSDAAPTFHSIWLCDSVMDKPITIADTEKYTYSKE